MSDGVPVFLGLALVIIPLWKMCRHVGIHPALSIVPSVVLGAAAFWYFTSSKPESDAIASVKERLSDPGSAQFRNVQAKNGAVCGEVNAKNKMGGYVGFTRFMYLKGSAHVWRSDPESADERLVNEAISTLCA